VIGVIETGMVDAELLRQTIAKLPEGTWELVCHPGYDDADLGAVRTRLRASRGQERDLLVSPEFRQFLAEQKIELLGYRRFVEELGEKSRKTAAP